MAPIISPDSLVGIMSRGLDGGLMPSSIFISACSESGLRHFSKIWKQVRSVSHNQTLRKAAGLQVILRLWMSPAVCSQVSFI